MSPRSQSFAKLVTSEMPPAREHLGKRRHDIELSKAMKYYEQTWRSIVKPIKE